MANYTTRQAIVRAAEKIFARDGFTSASIDDVAEAANIAKGTVYYHFRSKDELFFEIIDNGINGLADDIEKKLIDYNSPKTILRNLIRIHYDFFKKRNEFCQVLFSELWRLKSHWKRDLVKLKAKYQLVMVKVIKKSGVNLSISADDAADYFFWLVSMVCLNTILNDPAKSTQSMDKLYTFILKGLSSDRL
ncbi:TetR/AcrR family transcriptional regulator [Candidatus Roizmanbacteria bacterium]|jgi:AcrR family transcriptional regulator|nr:TetR/AcrR family transcriptional regulator [Candidatus Roizmanbacteria bacterium]